MGLVELANLATVVSAVLGGGSLLLQILPFIQLKGEYESLRSALKGIRSPQDEPTQNVYGNEAAWLDLVRWLDRGQMIVNPVRRRVFRRAVIAAAAIVTLIATVIFDNLGATDKSGAVAWLDLVALILVAIGPRLTFLKRWLLTEAEAKFLTNLHDLEEAFYRREVAPRLDLFNAVFARQFSHVQGSAGDEFAVLRAELEKLNIRVAELAAKKELPQIAPYSNLENVQLTSTSDGNVTGIKLPNPTAQPDGYTAG